MITRRFVAVYGAIGLVVMVVLLALVFLKKVPESFNVPFLVVAIVLFLGRIILRLILARQEKKTSAGVIQDSPPDQELHP